MKLVKKKNQNVAIMVLMYYLGTDFEGGEKPKGGP